MCKGAQPERGTRAIARVAGGGRVGTCPALAGMFAAWAITVGFAQGPGVGNPP